jgi:hypothetical protein
MHPLTSSLNVHKLAVEGTGCTGMGFTLMLMTNFPNLSFFLIVSGCYTMGGPIIRLRSASLAPTVIVLFWSIKAYCPESFMAKADI